MSLSGLNCLPLLSYCLGYFYLSVSKVKDLAVCCNDCFGRIFGFKCCESVKELQLFGGELLSEYLCDLQKFKFITSASKIPDKILVLYKFQNTVLSELCCKYGDACVLDMKRAVWTYSAKSLNV